MKCEALFSLKNKKKMSAAVLIAVYELKVLRYSADNIHIERCILNAHYDLSVTSRLTKLRLLL